MDLLTNRLLVMAGQVADNQVAELIYNERLELERSRKRSPREKMLSSKTLDAENQARRENFTNTISAKRLVISRKKKEENKYNAKEDKKSTEIQNAKYGFKYASTETIPIKIIISSAITKIARK